MEMLGRLARQARKKAALLKPGPATVHPNQDRSRSALRTLQKSLADVPRYTPGRVTVYGWDLEYVDALALISSFDAQVVKRMNDFATSKNAPVILDCGANIGLSVLRFKELYPEARITAFEPDRAICEVLRRNLSVNGLDDVEVVEAAVWTASGKQMLIPEGADGSRLAISYPALSDGGYPVDTVRLADYLSGSVDYLKLDIEGAESLVLADCADELANVDQLVVEVHHRVDHAGELGTILQVLEEAGFKVAVNSYGRWIDLTQSFVRDPHLNSDQLLLVCGWRSTPSRNTRQA